MNEKKKVDAGMTIVDMLAKANARRQSSEKLVIRLRTRDRAELNDLLETYKLVAKNPALSETDRRSADLIIPYIEGRIRMLAKTDGKGELQAFADAFVNECVEQWAETMRNGSFKINKNVAEVIFENLGYLAERDWFGFAMRPIDRNTVSVLYQIDYEAMPNWMIRKVNEEKDVIKLPYHKEDLEVHGDCDDGCGYEDYVAMKERERRVIVLKKR